MAILNNQTKPKITPYFYGVFFENKALHNPSLLPRQELNTMEPLLYTGMTVLLVEDEPIAAKVQRQNLEKMGFTVELAIDGNQAYEMYLNNYNRYILIILDARLPDIDGFELAKRIREHELNNNISRMPLGVISANPKEEVKQNSELVGIDKHEEKPIKKEQLTIFIQELLKLRLS